MKKILLLIMVLLIACPSFAIQSAKVTKNNSQEQGLTVGLVFIILRNFKKFTIPLT